MQLSICVAKKSGETKNTWHKNTNTTITTTTSWESESRTACCRCVPAKKPEPHPFLLSPKKQRQPSKFYEMQQSCTHWEMTWSHDPRRVGIFLCPVRVKNASFGGWFLCPQIQFMTHKLLVWSWSSVFNQTELLTHLGKGLAVVDMYFPYSFRNELLHPLASFFVPSWPQHHSTLRSV